jgi:hypothetical protein
MVGHRRVRRRVCWTAAAALFASGAILLGAAAAQAAAAPAITSGPTITGTPQEGVPLLATASWTGNPPPTVTWAWLRCSDTKRKCSEIPSAASDTYVPTAEDVGQVLRVRRTLTNALGSAEEWSQPTAVVLAAPTPTPGPGDAHPHADGHADAHADPHGHAHADPHGHAHADPHGHAHADPHGHAHADAGADPPDTPAPTTPPLAEPSQPEIPLMLRPFPVIRVKGRLTEHGARITLLTVRAPRGSRIGVLCRGGSCPRPRLARMAAVARLRSFERELLAGTRLELTVTKPDSIGKWTVIVIRHGAPPSRRDGCLESNTMRHVPCPAE